MRWDGMEVGTGLITVPAGEGGRGREPYPGRPEGRMEEG